MKKVLLSLWLVSSFASLSFAQLPPGKWWRQPGVVREIGITDEQQSRLDSVFQNTAPGLIDLKAEVEKRTLALRQEMDQPQVDRQALQRAAASLSEARARLFERELMMFVDMRSVLSQDQWTRFRRALQAREAMQRDQRMRKGGMRPGRDPIKRPPGERQPRPEGRQPRQPRPSGRP